MLNENFSRTLHENLQSCKNIGPFIPRFKVKPRFGVW